MPLDRELQLKVLKYLAACYPDGTYEFKENAPGMPGTLNEGWAPPNPEPFGNVTEQSLIATLRYLEDHGLVTNGYKRTEMIGGAGQWLAHERTNITARGLDFLADDGGLTAMLGVVTVRIDAAQWAEHLASKVEALDTISHEERSELAKAIRSLPAKAIEKVSGKLLDWGVDHAVDALPLLHRLIDQAAGSLS